MLLPMSGPGPVYSPTVAGHKNGDEYEQETDPVVPLERLALEEEPDEDDEDSEGDRLLNDLEPGGIDPFPEADPIGGDLQAILEKGDEPAQQDRQPPGPVRFLQVVIPGKGHEDVRSKQQQDGNHAMTGLRQNKPDNVSPTRDPHPSGPAQAA